MSATAQVIAVAGLVAASLAWGLWWAIRGLRRFLGGEACDCPHCPRSR